MQRKQTGLTLVEAMVAVAIVAILAAIGLPSFSNFIISKRVEGFANNILGDIQNARSESARRNTPIHLKVDTDCYVIYTDDATAAGCSGVTPSSAGIKTGTIPTGSGISMATTLAAVATFDPQRGMVDNTGDITVSNGSHSLTISIGLTGRPKICRPAGSPFNSYQAC